MQASEVYQNNYTKTRCELDFLFFIRYVFINYYGVSWVHNWHHDEIIKLIYAIERRDPRTPNAVINMPPRYGKTEMLVILWVCWTMIRNPRAQFLHGSYSVDLALKNSAMVRDILKSDVIQKYWPIHMRDSSDAKGLWLTDEGGGMKSDSSAGTMTGFGAGILSWVDGDPFDGCIILDDPLKPDDARSEKGRFAVNERLSGTIHSRKNHKQVPIVIVMQRLHVDDPSGVALSGEVMGDKFYHLKLPALHDGNPLWEFKHSMDMLDKMRLHNPEVFAGQYQQEPFIAAGEVYKSDWFSSYKTLPTGDQRTQIIHSWDTAYKAGTHNDPSVCLVFHTTPSLFYLAEVHHGKWEYPELRKRAFDLANDQKPDVILIEDKASGQSLIQEFKESSAHPVIALKPDADKETRARTTAAMVEAGKVALPEKAGWLGDFMNEIVSFPKGSHDDQVDALSQFLRYMRDNNDGDFMAMMDRLYG